MVSTLIPDNLSPHLPPPLPPPSLDSFAPLTPAEVKAAILSSSDSTCELDLLPTKLLKACLDQLLPSITTLFNLCIAESTFPSCFKHALVSPLLKSHQKNHDDLSSYRPISNLSFLSKILERVLHQRLLSHLQSFSSLPPHQSAYRQCHSVETALLRIHNDLLIAMEKKQISALILLDLSAAFDTVDHQILLSRLSLNFGITGSALSLLSSYVSNRTQSVVINSVLSDSNLVTSGVPQGSVLGPLLFTLYTTPLSYLLNSSDNLSHHFYADDTQLYISFSADNPTTALSSLSSTLEEIHCWLTRNKLCLNPSKTEFLIIGNNAQRAKFSSQSFSFSNTTVPISKSARNLGFIFDSELSLNNQISAVSKSCFFQIRQLRKIRSSLDHNSAVLLANSLVSSRLDFCNSLYFGLPQASINRLQHIQNALVRAVFPQLNRRDHVSSFLRQLHWLPIEQRIIYKIALLTFKTLQYHTPTYLFDLLTVPTPSSRNLRSSSKSLLTVPRIDSQAGRRSFSFSSASVWNSLPLQLRKCSTLTAFCSRLKTFLFPYYPP